MKKYNAEKHNGEWLTTLRTDYDLRKKDISKIANIHPATVSQIEMGIVGIKDEAIKRLATYFDIPKERILALSKSNNIPEMEAQRIRKEMNCEDDNVISLRSVADHLKLVIEHLPTNYPICFAGMVGKEEDRKIFVSEKLDKYIYRTTLAHEIGHVVMHGFSENADREGVVFASSARMEGKNLALEKEANRFAGELLLPHKKLKECINQCKQSHLDNLPVICSEQFHVPQAVVGMQLAFHGHSMF